MRTRCDGIHCSENTVLYLKYIPVPVVFRRSGIDVVIADQIVAVVYLDIRTGSRERTGGRIAVNIIVVASVCIRLEGNGFRSIARGVIQIQIGNFRSACVICRFVAVIDMERCTVPGCACQMGIQIGR